MKTKPTQLKTNLESQTALQAIQALEKLAVDDIVLEALANEYEIGRLADRIAQTLTILARDYTATAETFLTHGAVALVNICNDLPELKTQLVCRIEARKLYKNLLK